jgi:hypothetical protein
VFFTIVNEASVVLISGGVYRQSDVYVRGRHIYAKHGGGYIRISGYDSSTSAPKVKYEDLELPFTPVKDSLFRLLVPEGWTQQT